MENKEIKAQELVDILMAFLFCSYAKATTHKEFDVDIAVYIRPAMTYQRG